MSLMLCFKATREISLKNIIIRLNKTLLTGLEDITEEISQKIEQLQKKDGNRKKKKVN